MTDNTYFDLAAAAQLNRDEIVDAIKHGDLLKLLTISKSADVDDIVERIKNLEDEVYEVEIFANIAEGTSGTIEIPSGAIIRLDQYEDLGDCLLANVENNKPSETAPVNSSGGTVVCSLDASGNYVFNGTPVYYPVAIIYQVAIKGIDIGNISLDVILDWSRIDSAENILFDNTDTTLTAISIQAAISELSSKIDWMYLATSWKETPYYIDTIPDYDIYAYEYRSQMLYRSVPTVYTTAGDTFYEFYEGGVLSGILATRG